MRKFKWNSLDIGFLFIRKNVLWWKLFLLWNTVVLLHAWNNWRCTFTFYLNSLSRHFPTCSDINSNVMRFTWDLISPPSRNVVNVVTELVRDWREAPVRAAAVYFERCDRKCCLCTCVLTQVPGDGNGRIFLTAGKFGAGSVFKLFSGLQWK